jgi:hypothetical protein
MALESFILYNSYRDYLKAKATYEWPSTLGSVVASEIKEKSSDGGFSYEPVVTYEYQVEGNTLRSSKLKISEVITNGSYSQAEKLIRHFPVGRKVDVIYNPEDPQESVLVEGMSSKWLWTTIGFAVFFFILAAIAVVKPGFPFI